MGASIRDLEKHIIEIRTKIEDIQKACSHPEAAVTKEAGSNTGNYDPSCDSYWYDYFCNCCEKRWREYS